MRNVVIALSLSLFLERPLGGSLHTLAAEKDEKAYSPPIAAASDELQKAISFTL